MDQNLSNNDSSHTKIPPTQFFNQKNEQDKNIKKSKKKKYFLFLISGSIVFLFLCFIMIIIISINSEPSSGPIVVAKNQSEVSYNQVSELFTNYREYKEQDLKDFVNNLIGKEVHWIGIVNQVHDERVSLTFGGENSDIVDLPITNQFQYQTNDMVEFVAIIDDMGYFLGLYRIELINPTVISIVRPIINSQAKPTLYYDITSPIYRQIITNTRQPSTRIVIPTILNPTEISDSSFTPSPIISIKTTFTSTSPSPTHTYIILLTPSVTTTRSPSPTLSRTPTKTPTRTIQITSTTSPLVDVPSLLGKSVSEVESIIGKTILITPNDDYDDSTAGGEYRDYYIGDYLVFISYDKYGISRIFTVLEGLESENYSLQDWNILLPKFGIYINSEPDLKSQTLFSWDNQNELYIGIASISSKGYPVWTVKIAQQGYE